MSRRRTRRGFTLIELLVVVAIISVLMAILLPSLGQARHQAKAAACLANLKGIGTANASYETDNNGIVLPYLVSRNSDGYQASWVGLLVDGGYAKSFANSTRSPFFCPEGIDRQDAGYGWDVGSQEDPNGAQWLGKTTADGTVYKCNYALNCMEAWSGGAWWSPGGTVNYGDYLSARCLNDNPGINPQQHTLHIADAEEPSRCIFAFDGMDYLGFGDSHRINLRHGPDGVSETNFLCLDGHAQTLKKNDFPNDTQNFYDPHMYDNHNNFSLRWGAVSTGWQW